jgi:hypothetical protein
MRIIMILMLFASSNVAFGQQLWDYWCPQTECREYAGPSYTVWAEVDIFGECNNYAQPYAYSAAFAACSKGVVEAYAYASTSWALETPGWVEANSGFLDTGNAGYSHTDCWGYNCKSPPWIDPNC